MIKYFSKYISNTEFLFLAALCGPQDLTSLQSGTEPRPLARKAPSPYHWSAREILPDDFKPAHCSSQHKIKTFWRDRQAPWRVRANKGYCRCQII